MKTFKGIPASEGIVIGKAFVYRPQELVIKLRKIEDIDLEISRFNSAVEKSRSQLEEIKSATLTKAGKEIADIFEAHLLILEDPAFVDEIRKRIKEREINAEAAVQEVVQEYITLLSSLESEYMQARAADVEDVGKRLIRNLMGIQEIHLEELSEPVIIVAKDLAPSDTARIPAGKVLAFCTARGSITSHTAILAKSSGLPAVVGLGDTLLENVQTDELVIVDGEKGIVIASPSPEEVKHYLKRKECLELMRKHLKELAKEETFTMDGRRVEVAANIGDVESAKLAIDYGAEGVGLLRTEFLYLDRAVPPNEEEQLAAYCKIAKALGNRPLIIRTLDIGGDKPVPYLKIEREANPFLGCRGIRLSFKESQLFKTQLRAILRAAAIYPSIKIMFPMVTDISEVLKAKAVLAEVKAELEREGFCYAKDIELGIMIEIPAAAVAADILAPEVDFFSIGSNDLIQYTMACDRTNETVSYLYQPLHPASLRLIKNVIEAAHANGKWVGICGEMGGEPECIPILVGLGIDELSMRIASIPVAKEIIRRLTFSEAQALASQALSLKTAEEIGLMVREWLMHKCDFLKDIQLSS